MAHDEQRWLSPRLQKAAALCNQAPAASESPLWLGIDLGTCDVVSMVVDRDGQPVAVCLDWADVVRDGIVWDFFGAVTLVRRHLATLEQELGCRFTHAATSFPPGTDPRISINVLESAGLEISHVLDEPTAVADLLQLDNAGVVDIGGGTTGIAIVKQGRVTYSADEATGDHHISLTLAGNRSIGLEEAEQYKRSHAGEIWPVVKPVYEKMAEIVARHIAGQGIVDLWLAGGACMQPGVHELFRQRFPALPVHLPQHSLFMTPLAIANSGREKAEGCMQAELQTALFHAFDTLNLQQMKSFNVPPVTLHGVGALAACGPQAQSRGLRHLFVMVDSFLHQAGMTAGLERSLAMKGIAMTLWPCPAGEPCVTDVCAAVAQLRDARCDGVVAFGGGSVLDAAKAVALLVANPEQTLGEMTEHSELRPRLPLIAVPTTAGTGSETTNVTVIIDAVSGRKQVLAHASLMPDVAILDAALTEGVPPHITAMTGIDALTHAVEAYSARHATPFTDSLAMGAIAMIGEALPKAVGCGQDLAARENMLLASCMAGMAFSSAGLGLCHAMAHQPGAALHIPHGLANAMLLPTVMEFNRMVRRARFSQIGRALTGKKTDDREAIAAVRELIAEVGLTMRLTEAGATSAHYDAWAQAAQEDICLRTNPRTASREQIIELYAAAQ
ncbi:ethanolamine utilization ethanol dehydrogenase EutG [Klebsiella pneumoniae]|nr:ethanolamine utilization ethanol dehydrogenase EutG [Klebsiella pneumoniae]